jgi:hypothetical protein
MMRVDVRDQHVVEFALMRLLAGMGQKPGGVELLHRDAPAAIGHEFHGVLSKSRVSRTGDQRPVQLCHIPSSKTARLAAFSNPLAVTMTSVEVTRLRLASGAKLPPASIWAE